MNLEDWRATQAVDARERIKIKKSQLADGRIGAPARVFRSRGDGTLLDAVALEIDFTQVTRISAIEVGASFAIDRQAIHGKKVIGLVLAVEFGAHCVALDLSYGDVVLIGIRFVGGAHKIKRAEGEKISAVRPVLNAELPRFKALKV